MDMEHVGGVDKVMQLVVFSLGGEEYGVPIQYVIEIIRKPEVTQLPNAPAYIIGVINLRGQIIPIISLKTRFNLQLDMPRESKVVIVEYAGVTVGMEVCEVREVLRIESSRISAAPSLATTIDSTYISGVGKLENRLLIILDAERVFSDEENLMLSEIGGE